MKALRTESKQWVNLFSDGLFHLADEPYLLREQDDVDQLRLDAMADTTCEVEIVEGEFLTYDQIESIRREAFEAAREDADYDPILHRGSYFIPNKYPTADDYIKSL